MSNKKLIKNAFLISFFAITFHIFGQGFLRVDGQKIINDVNDNFILKGMGLGGWLVQEGYMLQTGEKDAEWQIREAIRELVGEEKTVELYELYHKNYVSKIDIDSLAAWGFNSIRLPMHWNKLISQISPLTYNEEGFKTIDTLLTWCEDNQMYLILDLHAAPGGQSKGGIADYNPSIPYLWESEEMKNVTVDLWKTLAQRYVNEEWIGGYDLINEPAEDLGPNAPALRDLYIRITNAIREVDNNHIVYIEGNWYATTFDGLTPPWDENMVYSFHKYWNQTDQGTINYLTAIRNTYDRPLWLGETGENSNEWFRENVELMAKNNIGWAWWPHKKIESISSPLSASKVEGYQQIVNYWNGSGSKPNDQYAYIVLVNQFNALKFENCKIQSAVHKSLFEPKPSTSSPFTYHEIPGIVFGSDYDLGGQGVGYYDSDYKNTSGGAYNSGWSYRNDGVDIERCSDFIRNGYNVGWIESGEWLKFTVNIVDSGFYKIDFRFASTTSDGIFLLSLGSKNLVNQSIPNTGGYQVWETITQDSVFLPEGEHTLQMRFFKTSNSGGFNFNYLEATSLVTDIADQYSIPDKFELSQNFPNPFNPSTKIRFSLPENSKVRLEVFDIIGQKVTDLAYGDFSAGFHEVNFNSSNLSSGLYIYKLTANKFISVKNMLLIK
jgi:hypothetical protein